MRARFALLTLLVVIAAAFSPLVAAAQTSWPSTAPSSVIVKVVPGLTTDQQAEIVARNGGTLSSSIPPLRLLVVAVAAEEVDATLARYQGDPQVQNAEINKTRTSEALPNDPLYVNQWALPKIGWDQVFGVITPTGSAKVALLDTGVDASHPELAGKVLSGTSILDGSDGTTDPSGHGTWLAGIIAAQTDTVPVEGIAAVAYTGVQIVPVTVLNANGEGQDSDVIAGVLWAADHGADVILMAFSAPDFSQNLQDAIDYAWSKGIVVVAAAGNNAVSTPTFPAGDRGVMGVAATDPTDSLAWFSNAGQAVFIAAPGVDIQTIDLTGNYIVISGTSASAAYVAGVAALMKAVDPTLTNGVIVGRIARNADPAGTQDETGNGRINMPRALADTNTDFIEPAGAAPVGNGGPFVGPYQAAAIQTNTTIASNLDPSGAGQSVTFTSTSTCNSCVFTASQTVSFVENANASCNGGTTLSSGNTLTVTNNGTATATATATFTTSSLTTGTHSIRACLVGGGSGNPNPQNSTSAALSQVVSPATRLAITSVNGGTDPTFGTAFAVVVQSQTSSSLPANVVATTSFSLTVTTGTGSIGTVSGTIAAGTNSVTVPGINYSKAENNVVLTATRTSGDALTAGNSAPFNVLQASSATTVSCPPSVPYTGDPQTPCTVSVTGAGGLNLTPTPTYTNNTDAGTATASYTFAGDANHLGSSDSKTFTITKASSTTVVTFEAGPYVYRGTAFTATAQVTGVGGLSSSVPVVFTGDCTNVTAANGCTATATFAGDANRLGSSDSQSITITKASSTTVVTFEGGPYVYRGTAFTAAAQVMGVGGLNSPVAVVYSGDCTNVTVANGCTATATFAGDANRLGSSDSKSITITQASSTTVVTFEGGPYVYRGTAFTATAQVTGVGGLSSSVPVVYTGDCTNVTVANGCTATATFAGDANRLGSSDSKSITITQASSTTVVTFEGGPYVYRATAFTATAQVTGVGGLNSPVAVVYSGDCTNVTVANGCTATATFAGDGNHFGSSDTKSITITQASSTTVVTFEGGPYGYRATTFTATAQVTGVGGLNSPVAVVYSGDCTNVTVANGCTATATYGGDTNHLGSIDSKSITITKADPTVTVVGNTCVFAPATPCAGTGSAKGVQGEDLGPVNLAYKDVQNNLLTSAPINAGTYQVAARFLGNTDYNQGQSASALIVINKAPATLALSNLIQIYSGSPDAATVTTNPAGLTGVSVTYNGSSVAPTAAGSYAVVATLTDDNYAAAQATGTLAIIQASAGADQTVDEGSMVVLNGSGYAVTYVWTQVSPASPVISISNPSSLQANFTAPPLPGGFGSTTFTFQLTALDDTFSTSATTNVTVKNVNHAPVAFASGPPAVAESTPGVTLDGSTSYDPDGDPITYSWIQTAGPTVTLVGADTPTAAFTAPLIGGGVGGPVNLTFQLTVSDGQLANSYSVTVAVDQVDHAPTANAGLNQTVNINTPVALDGSLSSDPDSDPTVSYTWTQTAGSPVSLDMSDPARPTFTAPNITGPLTFKLVVSDGVLSSTNVAQVTVTVVNQNLACNAAAPSIPLLWPPDHRMVPVSIVGLTDPAGVPPTITVTKVTSDEPTNGLGDGDTPIDAVIQPNGSVLLRSERSGNGDGRVYTITYTATTPLGTGCIDKTIKVGVPHDQGKGATPIDSGSKYDSTK